jgi:hypothetical protein
MNFPSTQFRKKMMFVMGIPPGCCTSCCKQVKKDDFKNEISRCEYGLSGMCQICQDDFFGTDKSPPPPEPCFHCGRGGCCLSHEYDPLEEAKFPSKSPYSDSWYSELKLLCRRGQAAQLRRSRCKPDVPLDNASAATASGSRAEMEAAESLCLLSTELALDKAISSGNIVVNRGVSSGLTKPCTLMSDFLVGASD